MIIRFSPDCKRQEIYANNGELATIMGKDRKGKKRMLTYPDSKKMRVHVFKNPVLVTDNYRIAELPPTKRDTLFSVLASRPRIVEYDNVSIAWSDKYRNVWSPSIDTLIYAKALRKVLAKRKRIYNVIEIGCGSGFLSKYTLAKCKSIKRMIINDLNPYAVQSARENIHDRRASFVVGDGLKQMQGKRFDLIICNPPYVPRPRSIEDNPYEGMSLLAHLVHDGQMYLSPGGIIVTNVSSLCWKQIFLKKPTMRMKMIEKLTVPLKVNNILNNPSWIKFLLKRGLKKNDKRGYEYWHTIHIIMFSPPSKVKLQGR